MDSFIQTKTDGIKTPQQSARTNWCENWTTSTNKGMSFGKIYVKNKHVTISATKAAKKQESFLFSKTDERCQKPKITTANGTKSKNMLCVCVCDCGHIGKIRSAASLDADAMES